MLHFVALVLRLSIDTKFAYLAQSCNRSIHLKAVDRLSPVARPLVNLLLTRLTRKLSSWLCFFAVETPKKEKQRIIYMLHQFIDKNLCPTQAASALTAGLD